MPYTLSADVDERPIIIVGAGTLGRRLALVSSVRHSHFPAMPDGNGCQAAYRSSLLDARGSGGAVRPGVVGRTLPLGSTLAMREGGGASRSGLV
jgi:hypothetical protein